MKIGVGLSIDVTKLDKSRFVEGKDGAKYCNLTVFIDTDQQDQYGQNGGIQIKATDEEREQKKKMGYVGNCKVFWRGESSSGYQSQQSQGSSDPGIEDIPF